ncbi:MAG: hypothetical protein ACREHG_01035 [Candidatus Saccharimonadales bacterium]
MKRQYIIANAILWAAAIIASAIVGAPSTLTVIFLPALAVVFLLIAAYGHRGRGAG